MLQNQSLSYLFFAILLGFFLAGNGQSFQNRSFEGTSQPGTRPPAPWMYDIAQSTPDHLPGRWLVSRPAKHGEKYAGIIYRPDSTTEYMGQKLSSPLKANQAYYFSVWLCYTNQYTPLGSYPAVLRVMGKQEGGEPFVLWTSPTIDHLDWKKYYVCFETGDEPIPYLYFNAYYNPLFHHSGGVLIDHIGYTYEGRAPKADLGADTILCQGETLQLDVYMDSATYLWQDGHAGPTYEIKEEGTYWVDITLNYLTVRDSLEVDFRYLLSDELRNDTLLCEGFFLDLDIGTADPGVRYEWNTGQTSSSIRIEQSGTYQITASSGRCVLRDDISVDFRNCELALVMPNVMSPNGDGINDAFVPVEIKDVYAPLLRIYNRWGKMIYSARSLDPAWQGESAAGPVPEGVYYWAIQYQDAYGKSYRDKGEILLMR